MTGLVKGNDTVQFVYDASGKPFLLRLNGTYDYYYLYNGQGDVTGLIDSNNTVVVQFEKRMAFFKLHLRRKNAAQIVPMPAAS